MADDMNIQEKLNKIQTELKAPKGQRNTYGNYNYRSCEDILEALKPLLAKYELTINLSDTIIQVGDRYYVQVIAKLTDVNTGEDVKASAYAREDENKKGMDASQLTGATSSYARKYALNGLLAIDDTKDSDYLNNGHREAPRGQKQRSRPKADETITLSMARDMPVQAGEYAGKTLGEVAEENLDVIKEWYEGASGDKKRVLALLINDKDGWQHE